ncbi:uncharacterized protein BP5553_08676 [Venustampulla echinocandica]|uniref:Uncharacterized protein n=1 Tax=Venustampulla echinocandica TaxID=2656787 RepID=A0A370TEX0_9HELO|nr:uncharacterized protein BP5553_08676 [Venustampulla echinocandica]RDL33237.1 hypothetical protein BP5553_08676 [Venustampulla echinocandica]
MLVLKSIVLAVVGLTSTVAAAACCSAEKRDVGGLRSDFALLNTAVKYNLGNITAYNGGVDNLGPLVTAGQLVSTVLTKTTADITAHAAFTTSDSITMLIEATNTLALLTNTLNALNNKQLLFRAAGIHTVVLKSIQEHSAEESEMYDQLVAKATNDTKSSFRGLQDTLKQLYDIVIKAYSA